MEPILSFAEKYAQSVFGYLDFIDESNTLSDILNELKTINNDLLRAMNEITDLINSHKPILLADVKHLYDLKIGYSKKIVNKLIIKSLGQEIIKNLLDVSLKEAYDKSKIFFNNEDVKQWGIRKNEYRVDLMLISEPKALDFIFIYLNNLYSSLEGLYFDFHTDFTVTAFNSIFNFEEVLEASLKEKGLIKSKQVFVDAISTCNLYCLNISNFDYKDKGYIDYLDRCHRAVDSYIYQIDNTPSIISPPYQESNFKLASKRKAGFLSILSAIYDSRMFEAVNVDIVNSKQEFLNDFGRFLGEEFEINNSSFSNLKKGIDAAFMKHYNANLKETVIVEISKTKIDSSLPKTHSIPFSEYLLYEKSELLANALKEKFSSEKGKTIRILLHAMQLKNPPLIALGNRKGQKLYDSLIDFFGSDIGSYQSIFNYKVQEGVDDDDLKSIVIRLNHVLKTLENHR